MLSEIASGEVDVSELLLLLAAVLFAIAAWLTRDSAPSVLAYIGWVAIAVALLVL